MQLHEIKFTYKHKQKKRVGRGGKRGTYSGHGIKGQKSRSGHRIRPAVRDLIQRLPKLRGFKFKSRIEKPIAVNLKDIEQKIKSLIVTKESLVKSKLIDNIHRPVKILGDGEVKRPLTVKGIKISEQAKAKIIAAGGKIE